MLKALFAPLTYSLMPCVCVCASIVFCSQCMKRDLLMWCRQIESSEYRIVVFLQSKPRDVSLVPAEGKNARSMKHWKTSKLRIYSIKSWKTSEIPLKDFPSVHNRYSVYSSLLLLWIPRHQTESHIGQKSALSWTKPTSKQRQKPNPFSTLNSCLHAHR